MKYLKTFEGKSNEYRIMSTTHIKKFCEDNLAYLLDSGFILIVDRDSRDSSNYEIVILKDKPTDTFSWSDIKYDFIPFFEILDIEYDIISVSGSSYNGYDNSGYVKFTTKRKTGPNEFRFKKNDILNDNLINRYREKLIKLGIESSSKMRYKRSIDPVFEKIIIKIK
jgi:hypothetical protein